MILTIRDVERAVCLRFQLTREQILEKNPKRMVARPRQIAMYLARELTGASFPRLGQYFRRDHTSVLYAWRKTLERMAGDARFKAEVEGCKEILQKTDRWKENVARAVKERGIAGEVQG
jgi:chromosomal replication initiator protein